jgi:hypothetical protein
VLLLKDFSSSVSYLESTVTRASARIDSKRPTGNEIPLTLAMDLAGCETGCLHPKNENAATRLPQRLAKIIANEIIARIQFGSTEK